MIPLALPTQSPPPRESIAFHFERPGVPVPLFTLTVQADGTAIYQASYPPEPPAYNPYSATLRPQPNTDVAIHVALTAARTARLFDEVRTADKFANGCASKAKNIASSGRKTLTYRDGPETASCAFDYTEDKTIAALTDTFEAIAFTLDAGHRLELEHRYDRLSLDPEMARLVGAVDDGRALELAAIAPTLRSLVDDPQVLVRVRTRAASLLAKAEASAQ